MTRPAMSAPDPDSVAQPARCRGDLPHLIARATPVLRRVAPELMGAVLRQRCRTSDLVQSALAEAVAQLPSFRGDGETEFIGWTLRIMERNALDRRRRLTARKRAVDCERAEDGTRAGAVPAGGPSPSQVAIDREQLLRVAKALRRLPTDQRRVLTIVALRGGNHADAARALGRSEGACRVLLARARAALLVDLARRRGDGC